MPIKVLEGLPAIGKLEQENIFVITEHRANRQDIRPLKILILNLMPTKVETETQLLRLLGNTPLQIEGELLQVVTHVAKNTSAEHLLHFYKRFDEINGNRYDGMIITGAPVEQMEFAEVNYWPELCDIMEWSKHNVYSTLHICWGAQAGLYYHFGVQKYNLPEKMFGVFQHTSLIPTHPLTRGFDDYFWAPHSRYTTIERHDVEKIPQLEILATSPVAGVYLVGNRNGRQFFVMGHSEYDRDTLAKEYLRDINKGIEIKLPPNYFPEDNPNNPPVMTWRGHANMLFCNWLNYFVYQRTPYDLADL